jgi:hypothetical protein
MRRERIGAFGATTLMIIGLVALSTRSAEGMTGGLAQPGLPWEGVLIQNGTPECTGTVIGDAWVISAAHCAPSSKNLPKLRIAVGRANWSTNDGAAYAVDKAIVAPGYDAADTGVRDIALFHLIGFDVARWNAVPLASESSVINDVGGVTLFGYGYQSPPDKKHPKGTGTVGVLQKSKDGAYFRNPSCDANGKMCISEQTSDYPLGGDSGGPWMRWVSGAWQIIGIEKGAVGGQFGYGSYATSPLVYLPGPVRMLDWIRATVGIPSYPDNTIVRNSTSGNMWIVRNGYRNYIPSVDIYNCLVQSGAAPYMNVKQIVIDTVPDRVGTWASCTTTPPPTWLEQETPNHPVNTFLNYHNASGVGAPIAAGQWVEVKCRVYDPTIVSANPDGWWYRIHSAPWSDMYYATANTFMNGDPYGGPYTHNTDFNIAVC